MGRRWNLLSSGWSELTPGVDVFFRKGESSGPFALITAGIHGDEYEGPAAVAAFVEQLATIPFVKGLIAAIPAANPMAWRGAQRTSPEDGLNLARTFPGKAQGSATERLAASLFEVAAQADFLIDLHSGGVEYLFLPLCGFYGYANDENQSYAAARHFGLPVLWQLPQTAGVLSGELSQRGRCVADASIWRGPVTARWPQDLHTRNSFLSRALETYRRRVRVACRGACVRRGVAVVDR